MKTNWENNISANSTIEQVKIVILIVYLRVIHAHCAYICVLRNVRTYICDNINDYYTVRFSMCIKI